jgi:small subunit ribosomal protein S1
MSWTKRVKHPSEVLKKGDDVTAVVLSIDAENQRLSLGLKQLETDVWEHFFNTHRAGDVIEAKVTRSTSFGVFAELAEGVEGLVHVSELDDKRVEKPEDQFKGGETVKVKILKMTEVDRKIGLSIKAAKNEEVTRDLAALRQSQQADSNATTAMADAFKALTKK